MEKKYLTVNRGSASEKYAIYTKDKCLVFLHLERREVGGGYISNLIMGEPASAQSSGVAKEEKQITEGEYNNSLNYALNLFVSLGIISDKKEINGVGIRIVAPGKHFQDDKVIDKVYEKEIKKVIHDAPLHLLPTYEMIKVLQKTLKNIPNVGISDSDFHDTIPEKAKYYAIPFADTKKYNIERYGYHGISIESILNKLKTEGPLPEKLIICHIGSGVSVTAVKDGQSIENSMGFTPLEGVMMATRGGNIDPGVIAMLADKLRLNPKKLKEYLNKKCGLFGVSDKSSDVRDLIRFEKEGDAQAKLALDMFAYQLQKCIGAYFVALGGLDTLVFTATVGERSFIMRERICDGLISLGININREKNNHSVGIDADISAPDLPTQTGSKVKVLIRRTDEMGQIARDTINILEA